MGLGGPQQAALLSCSGPAFGTPQVHPTDCMHWVSEMGDKPLSGPAVLPQFTSLAFGCEQT